MGPALVGSSLSGKGWGDLHGQHHGGMNCKFYSTCPGRRSDIHQNDTQHNDTQHNDTQHNDTQHNDTQDNDTQHNDSA